MTVLNFVFDGRTTRIEVDRSILTGGRLPLCIVQCPAQMEAIDGDQCRPLVVNVMRELLSGSTRHPRTALQDMVPGGDPVVIVAPEYAFGSDDWVAVDTIVRAAQRPIVLIAGFGASLGQSILDWRTNEIAEQTKRHLSWQEPQNGISTVRRVNGAWCWIHEPGVDTHCVVFLKNVLEQNLEAVTLPDLQTGNTVLHLQFNDIDVFPAICADLIGPAAQSADNPQKRIQGMLEAMPADRPALVVGSLLQNGFNTNWANAIHSLLNNVLANRPGAVALCNIAYDKPSADESEDKWRSLSGVFAPYNKLPKGQKNLPAARALSEHGIEGAVVRETRACVTSGIIGWSPFDPVNGSFVWHGDMSSPIDANGIAAPVRTPLPPATCELRRFLKRFPPDADAAPRLTVGINAMFAHIETATPPLASAMLQTILEGVESQQHHDPDLLHKAEVTSALKAGIHALATLKSVEGVEWQSVPSLAGQLRINATDRHLLVWRSSGKSPQAMRRVLASWRVLPGDHPDLVVLGGGPTGDLPKGMVHEDRRDDITLSPQNALNVRGSLATLGSDITTPRIRRRVATLGLAHVAAVYCGYVATEDDDRIALLLNEIDALFI